MGTEGWPVELAGVTETVVTTLGPNERWNVAALGVHAPAFGEVTSDTPTARTWGRTRTWRNFRERGEGYVQFVRDPRVFVDAALAIRESDDPVLPEAHAWIRVRVEEVNRGTTGGTDWVDWALHAENSNVDSRVVPTYNRGYGAVIEATVAASRLGVGGYDSEQLRDRIAYFEGVVDRSGGPRERDAFDRILELID